MQKIKINKEALTEGTVLLAQEEGAYSLQLAKSGSGILLPQLMDCPEHLLTFYIEVEEEHSLPMHLLLFARGEEEPAMEVRFGLLPRVRAMICIDLQWLDARELFPEAMPGTLKIVCHGRRVDRSEISKVILSSMACFHDVRVKLEELLLTDEYPQNPALPDVKLVDCFGQDSRRSWKDKTEDLESLRDKLKKQYEEKDAAYPFEDWTEYGGWKKKKLKEEAKRRDRILLPLQGRGKMVADRPSGLRLFQCGAGLRGPGERRQGRRRGEVAGLAA